MLLSLGRQRANGEAALARLCLSRPCPASEHPTLQPITKECIGGGCGEQGSLVCPRSESFSGQQTGQDDRFRCTGTIVQRVKFPPHFNVPPHTHSSSCTLRLPLPHVLPFESVCTLRCLRQTLYHPRLLSSPGCVHNGFDDFLHSIVWNHAFEFHFRNKTNRTLTPCVDFSMTLLRPKAFDFAYWHPFNSELL